MAKLSTYVSSTATAWESNRLANPNHLANWVSWTRSWLDGATDVTTALQSAINARRSAAVHTEHRPTLWLPEGKYLISDTLDCNKVSIRSSGAVILAESVGAAKAAMSWNQSDETQWGAWNGPTASGLYILGRNTPVTTPTYTATSIGISAGAPGLIFDGIFVRNFDKAILGGTQYQYIQTWKNVWALNNNYAVYWPSNGGASGEKVGFIECNFSNNNIGVYIRHNDSGGTGTGAGGSFQFLNCAMDYNITKAMDIIGPGSSVADQLASVLIMGGHYETLIATSGSNPRITNGGVLKIIGAQIYDDYDNVINTSFYGRTSLLGVHYAIAGTETKGDGSGTYKTFGSTQRYGGTLTVDTGVTEAW
jgi:hypothetical protein